MRLIALVLMMTVALPLRAQTPPVAPVPVGGIFQAPLPPAPNGNAQVQQAIVKMLPTIPKGREVLSMDLDSVLLVSAAKSLSGLEDSNFEIRKLLGGLKSIQIRGFEIEGAGPEVYRSRIQPIRDVLKEPLWVRYAVNTSAQGEMEIWSGRLGNTPTGVLLLSITGKQVFIMNVAGNIRPDQLIFLSGMIGIPNFKLPLGRN